MNRDAIELLKPHTHAGRGYPTGTVLNLADTGLQPDSAQWLVTLGAARWLLPGPQPTPTPEPDSIPEPTHEEG